MGQYLSIGLMKDLHLNKSENEKRSFEELKPELKEKGYDLDLFEQKKITESYWGGELKQDILNNELLAFTEAVFTFLKKFSELSDDNQVLESLKQETNLLNFFDEASFYNFQNDSYGAMSYLKIEEKRVTASFTTISFIMKGKIFMEEDDGIFELLSFTLQSYLSEFQLSKALKVYITG
jgi:hypothetical protein